MARVMIDPTQLPIEEPTVLGEDLDLTDGGKLRYRILRVATVLRMTVSGVGALES